MATGTDGDAAERIVFTLCGLLVVGLAVTGVFAAAQPANQWSIAAAGIATGLASALVGALLGLLFGIPRLVAQVAPPGPSDPTGPNGGAAPTQTGGYTSNTNFEEVSDWLTKILLGAGLTQIGQVAGKFGKLGDYLAPSLGDSPNAAPFAVGLVVFNSVAGFVVLYLSARLWLGRAFSEADRHARESALLNVEIGALPLAPSKTLGNLPKPDDLSEQEKASALDIYEGMTRIEAATPTPTFGEDAYRRVAQQLVKAGSFDQAVSALEVAFSQFQDPDLLDFAGAVRAVYQQQYDEAERLYLRALQTKPDFADAFYNLACNEARRQRPERALGYLQQAFTLDPGLREFAQNDHVWDAYRGHEPLDALLS